MKLKFQAYDHKKKIMINQDETDRLDKCFIYYETHPKVTIRQSTGFFDGVVEIFDRDILNGPDEFPVVVQAIDGCWKVVCPQREFYELPLKDYLFNNSKRRVIGNTIQNKKLLQCSLKNNI